MELTIKRPDDWHIHLRDGDFLAQTVLDCSRVMKRAIVMPNLTPPVVTTEDALAYRHRILAALDENSTFDPLMTLYLTDTTSVEEIAKAAESGVVHALKLYPAGATTNSDSGVTDIRGRYPIFAAMAKAGLKLLVHGEVTTPSTDIFDRESVFLSSFLADIVRDFPTLKIVLEHITTRDAVRFVEAAPDNLAATITAHHLLFNRNHMLAGRIRPHFYCLPILKRQEDQAELLRAATSGNPKFFLGTDSAPHRQEMKESDCGCAGSYTANVALELYAMAFESVGRLDRLEGFASIFGPNFYDLPQNQETLTLSKTPQFVSKTLPYGAGALIPLLGGTEIPWSLQTN